VNRIESTSNRIDWVFLESPSSSLQHWLC